MLPTCARQAMEPSQRPGFRVYKYPSRAPLKDLQGFRLQGFRVFWFTASCKGSFQVIFTDYLGFRG